MDHGIALQIAKTGILEIRVLLRSSKVDQALEIAEALKNIPLQESNAAQSEDMERSITNYLARYPERRELSHWQSLFKKSIA